MRKYQVNENYFENIDTEEKAYWLGFLYADGCVTQATAHSRRLQINLSVKDKHHLYLLKESLGSTAEIKDFLSDGSKHNFGKSEQSRLTINSNKLCDDLIDKGCKPNKTNTATAPKIEEKLMKHFIRGLIDGDGSFSIIPRKDYNGNRVQFELVGNSMELIEFVKEFLCENNINVNIYLRKTNNTKRLITSSIKEIAKLFELIYKDSKIHLQRKYDKIEKIYTLSRPTSSPQ